MAFLGLGTANPEASAVGKACAVWGISTHTKDTPAYAIITDYTSTKGYSWGSKRVWFPKARILSEAEIGLGKQQDSGADLVGVICWVWDNVKDNARPFMVRNFRHGKPYPYVAADTIFTHARPFYLGDPKGDQREEPREERSSRAPLYLPDPREATDHTQKAKSKKKHPEEPVQILTSEWDKVKGQESAKRALREAVEFPITFSALYAAYKKRPSKGVMLYGPPGCGKTMLGRTLAKAMGFGEAGFQYIKGSEIFGRFVGQEQEAIARHFEQAREYQKRTGKRKILFYDEAETIFQRRETGNNDGGHQSRQQAIARFLAEVDGLETSGAFVILASNIPHLIDPAVTREGRIDRKVKVDRPNREVCAEILSAGFKEVPCFGKIDPVAVALDSVYDPAKCYAAIETDDRGTVRVCYHHAVSGAVMDGIVERTIANALDRDIKAGNTEPSGITAQDVKDAVEDAWRSTWDMDNRWLFEEVTGGVQPTAIKVFKGKRMGIGSDKLKHEIEVKVKGETGPEIPGIDLSEE